MIYNLCIVLVIFIATQSRCQSTINLQLLEPEQTEPILKYKLIVSIPNSVQIDESEIKCIDHAKSGKRAGLRKINEEVNDERKIQFDVIPLENNQLIFCTLEASESNQISFTDKKRYSSYVIKIDIPFDKTGPEFAKTVMDLIQPSVFDVSYAGEPNSLQAITAVPIQPTSLRPIQGKLLTFGSTDITSSVLCTTKTVAGYLLNSTVIGKYIIPDENLVDDDENAIRIQCTGDYYQGGTWSEENIKILTTAKRSMRKVKEKVSEIAKQIGEWGAKKSVHVRELNPLANFVDETARSPKNVLQKLQRNNDTNRLLATLDKLLLNVTGLPMAGLKDEVRERIAIRVENLKVTGSAGVLALADNIGNTTHINSLTSLFHNDSSLNIQIEALVAAVRLPETVLRNSDHALFTVQSRGELFSTSSMTSATVGAELTGGPFKNLQEPVRIYFRRNQAERPRHGQCVSWDFSMNSGLGDWSPSGCKFHKTHYDSNTTIHDANSCEEPKLEGFVLDECWCYHLTHFGEIFMDHSLQVDKDQVLDIISLVGVSLSLVGLTAVLITTFAFPKLIQRAGQKTKIQITSNLAVLLLLFLVASQLPTGLPIPARVTLGITIHYSMLCNFSGMLIAAIMQYRRLIVVFTTDSPKLNRIYVVLAWVLPMVPPIVVLASGNYQAYCKPPLYLPRGLIFYLSLTLPLLLVLICNVAVFVIIAKSLYTSTKIRTHGDHGRFVVRFRQLLFLFLLLGLSWIFAMCQIVVPGNMVTVFSYLFCISIAIQGPAYFVFFVIMDKAAIREWKKLLCSKFSKDVVSETTTSTRSGNVKHTSGEYTSKHNSGSYV